VKKRISILLTLAALAVVAGACSFSTANMSSLKTSKDKEGKQETSAFKAGETLYAGAVISNAGSKTTTKFALVAEDAPGLKKGDVVPGTEVKVDLPSSGTATLTLPIPAGHKGGKFTLTADMLNETGEKKDSKSVPITIEAAPAPPPSAAPDDKDEDKDDN